MQIRNTGRLLYSRPASDWLCRKCRKRKPSSFRRGRWMKANEHGQGKVASYVSEKGHYGDCGQIHSRLDVYRQSQRPGRRPTNYLGRYGATLDLTVRSEEHTSELQ